MTAQLVYSILCDDVRLEMGNKLSLMGIFENVYLPSFPAVLLRFATVNHWVGAGDYQTQVRVVSPEGRDVAQSAQSTFRIDGKMVFQRPLFVALIQQTPTMLN